MCLHPQGSTNSSVKDQTTDISGFAGQTVFTATQLCHGHGCLPIKLYLQNEAAARFVSLLTPDVDYNCPCKLFPNLQHQEATISSAECIINKAAGSSTQNATDFFALQVRGLVFKANCNHFYTVLE